MPEPSSIVVPNSNPANEVRLSPSERLAYLYLEAGRRPLPALVALHSAAEAARCPVPGAQFYVTRAKAAAGCSQQYLAIPCLSRQAPGRYPEAP